jgi:hypothetical protein
MGPDPELGSLGIGSAAAASWDMSVVKHGVCHRGGRRLASGFGGARLAVGPESA